MIFYDNPVVREVVISAEDMAVTGEAITQLAESLAHYLDSFGAGQENPDRVSEADLARYRKDSASILADLESYAKSLTRDVAECKRRFSKMP